MPRVIFTDNIQRHLHCPPSHTDGRTVGEALGDFFRKHPQARSYVLDDQGAVRKHVVIFVDGLQIQDRRGLGDAVGPNAEVYVMQALSGG